MIYRYAILFFLFLVLTAFFKNDFGLNTKVEIRFYLSFDLHSTLRLNKKTDLGTFTVLGMKQKLNFKISNSDNEIFSNLFDEKYIKSLEITEKIPVADGMHVFANYKHNRKKISLDLGVNRAQRTDSILLRQILYLDSICADTTMKMYFKDLKRYFQKRI